MNKGVLSAAAAYILWGFIPIYFKLIAAVPAFQITAHRVIWSSLFLVLLVVLRRELPGLKRAINPRTLLIYLCSGILLAANWGTYVYAVNNGYIIEGSLGYFINPLVSVLLGVVFLHERLRPRQWIPVGMAAVGVIYLTASYGQFPWIAVALAFTFSMYSLMKKLGPLGSLYGTVVETVIIFLPALAFLLFEESQGVGSFGHVGLPVSILLALTGVVTAIPLLFFATAARTVPLTTLGLIQYVTPTLQFLIGVFVYHETFTPNHLLGFSIIWAALIIYSVENIVSIRRRISLQSSQKGQVQLD
jgi:chloramphenicol-sensitive protein RarD